jgi:hypothetical protein
VGELGEEFETFLRKAFKIRDFWICSKSRNRGYRGLLRDSPISSNTCAMSDKVHSMDDITADETSVVSCVSIFLHAYTHLSLMDIK